MPGGWALCHGVVIGTGMHNKGKPCGHAWLESNDLVIDASGKMVLKEVYYKIGQIRDVKHFTLEEALERGLSTKLYGPWNPAIDEAERWVGK